MNMRTLDGRVALITGAGGGSRGGIGAAIARCLAAQGARIAVNDLSHERAGSTVDELRALGAEAWATIGNVADPDEADEIVARTVEHFGQLDVLVNNAGIAGDRTEVERMSSENWLRVIQVDLNGPFYTTRAAIRVMRPRRFGRIINISSIAAERVSYFAGAAYTAAKAGLLGFTRHVAVEVSRYGITVNALLPGMTETPLMREHASSDALRTLAEAIPVLRTASPEDIGFVVAFLASEQAGYLSGSSIVVDGAMSVLPGDFRSYRKSTTKETV